MKKVKAFVEEKKLDKKFAKAGEGHSLNGSDTSSSQQSAKDAAREAALKRLEPAQASQRKKGAIKPLGDLTSSQSRAATAKPASPDTQSLQSVSSAARDESLQQQIRLSCPTCNHHFPPSSICDHLLTCDTVEVAISRIYSEQDIAIRDRCINTLGRYVQNAVAHAKEEKYRRIPYTNAAFIERVAAVPGGTEFLEAVGFARGRFVKDDGSEDSCLLITEELCTHPKLSESLQRLREGVLTVGQARRKATLVRDASVLKSSLAAELQRKVKLSDDFFAVDSSEVKALQQSLTSEVEKLQTLRTQAMRENERTKQFDYAFCCLRIRMPNGDVLQGIFRPFETVQVVAEFVRDCVKNRGEGFEIVLQIPPKLEQVDPTMTLAQAQLVPAALCVAKWTGGEGEVPALLDTLPETHV